jgi:class 3 adenylate cyclase
MSQTRRLAAILAADVAGYSRLMGADKEGTLERLKALRRELLDPKIAEHHGPDRQDHRRRHAGGVCERRRCGALRGRSAAGDA